MPWPATVGLNQPCYGVITNVNLTANDAATRALSVILPGGTAVTEAVVGQTVLAAIGLAGATTTAPGVASPFIPGVHCQAAIGTSGVLSIISAAGNMQGRSLIVFLTPITP